MATLVEPDPDWYGEAVLTRYFHDHRVTVERADDRIGIQLDLWNQMQPPHRIDDWNLVLDTAGEYRYRYLKAHPTQDVLIFERIRDDEPSSGGER